MICAVMALYNLQFYVRLSGVSPLTISTNLCFTIHFHKLIRYIPCFPSVSLDFCMSYKFQILRALLPHYIKEISYFFLILSISISLLQFSIKHPCCTNSMIFLASFCRTTPLLPQLTSSFIRILTNIH